MAYTVTEFNDYASPKVKTEHFKIYADVGGGTTPTWELQGRGIESWTVDTNQDVTKTVDVLGLVEMERGTPQPTQSGVTLRLRADSSLAGILFNAWLKNDTKDIDSIKILQKFEFVDHASVSSACVAKLNDETMIAINAFNGEADGYLSFDVDIHYSNKVTYGSMPITDGTTITFTADS